MSWFLSALAAPLLWGLPNVLDSAVRRHYIKSDSALMWVFAISRLPFVITFFLIAEAEFPSPTIFFFMVLAGVFWTFPMFLYFKALEFEEPSRISLLLQLMPVFTVLIAYLLIGESLSGKQGIAFVVLIIAGLLAALRKMEKKWHFSKAFALLIFAGMLWALSDVLFKKFESGFSSFLSAFAIYFLGSLIVSLKMIANKKGRKKIADNFSGLPLRAWVIMMFSLASGIGGSLIFAYALTLGKVSLTAVFLGLQPLAVFLYGLILAPLIPEVTKEKTDKKTILIKGLSFVLVIIGLMILEF